MMSAIDALNEATEVTLAGIPFKVRQIPTLRIFGLAEIYLREQAIENIKAVSALLSGREKIEFLAEQIGKLPAGPALERAARKIFASGEEPPAVLCCRIMHAALAADQPEITVEQVGQLLLRASTDEQVLAMRIANGTEGNGSGPDRTTSDGSAGNTAGRRKRSNG